MAELPGAIGPLVVAWVALVGAALGSFLNVVIGRVPAGESIVHPGSRCPACRTRIRWYDNVPLLSWALLRGRCRACGARISARYPLVEALGTAAALLAFARHGLSAQAAAELLLVDLLLALAFIDLDTWLLPHALTWPLVGAGLLANALRLGPAAELRPALYGAGLGFAGFAAIAVLGEKVFRREAMGWGDVFLLSGLGAWLGHAALLPVVLLASIQGAVVGMALIAAGRGEPGPAGPSSPPPGKGGVASGAATPAPLEGAGEAPRDGAAASDPGEAPSGAAPDVQHEPSHPGAAPEPSASPDAALEGGAPEPAPPAVDAEWIPPRHAVPFGPFLALGALEWLYLGDALARAVPLLRVFR